MRKAVMDWHGMQKEGPGPQSQLYYEPDGQEDDYEEADMRKTMREMEFECLFGERNRANGSARSRAAPVAKAPVRAEPKDDVHYWRAMAMSMVQNQNQANASDNNQGMRTRSKAKGPGF